MLIKHHNEAQAWIMGELADLANKLAEVLSQCGGSRLVSELRNLNKFPLNELVQLTTHFSDRFEMETITNGGRPGQWVRLIED